MNSTRFQLKIDQIRESDGRESIFGASAVSKYGQNGKNCITWGVRFLNVPKNVRFELEI